jgi:cytochrome c
MVSSPYSFIAVLVSATMAHAGPLHDAAGAGDVEKTRQLVAEGSDVDAVDPLVGTPLHKAALAGQVAIAEVLVAEGAKVNEVAGMLGGTPLHAAAVSGNVEIAALLVAHGADVNATSTHGNTPVHTAADRGKAQMIEFLVGEGADPDARNAKEIEPIELAGAAGYFDVVDLLFELGAMKGDPVEPISALLANADVERGSELVVSAGCSHCHALTKENTNVGPHLWNIVGQDMASSGTFDFSEALKRVGGTWTFEELNALLADPKRFAPGNTMSLATLRYEGVTGLKNANGRADIIAFLRPQSDSPRPLPE